MSKHKQMEIDNSVVFIDQPVHSAEEQEARMIVLANNLAEQQLRDGTASAQVICHFLKLGSSKEKLENEHLREENKLLKAKTAALEAEKTAAESNNEVIEAFKRYGGNLTFEIDEV